MKSRVFIIFFFILLTGIFNGCKDDPLPVNEGKLKITGVSIPSSLDVVADGPVTLSGKGFALNDQIRLVLVSDTTKIFQTSVNSATDQAAIFSLPAGITSGTYRLTVKRGNESLLLGTFSINVIADTNIPDVAGKTVKGVVFCDGKGIPGVVVSDGYEVTTTDSKGIYYLSSLKKSGFVFISIPGNYEVTADNNIPQFFKRLAGGSTVEQKDFSLIRIDNTKHVVLTMADWHLANRNDDLSQFNNGILADVNNSISSFKAAGTRVYGLTLGDMTWDAYWYENNYGLTEYLVQLNKINCQVFNMMGNHDNDPYIADDGLAEGKYKKTIGPTYYSFNLGNVHYIVLDDILYLNTGGSQGTIGDRNYSEIITSDQLEWFKKDLATIVNKNTPVVIALHSPLYKNPVLDNNGSEVNTIDLTNGTAILSALQGFSNVHVLSGHTHINYTVKSGGSVIEHNTGAVSATWWWTGKSGYAGNHICTDGSPGGYGVWEINGTDLKWYYKSAGSAKNYQFRSYDLNRVFINAATFAPNSTDTELSKYAGVYSSRNSSNEVLINVWGYDPDWKVEVRESGKSLSVKRVSAMDPLHIISYEAKRLNAGAVPTSSFVTNTTAHMFKVTASGPATTLDITVTDRFGNQFTETMVRPKEFTYLMK